jgi:hypothetical protein
MLSLSFAQRSVALNVMEIKVVFVSYSQKDGANSTKLASLQHPGFSE